MHHEDDVLDKALENLSPFSYIIHSTYSHTKNDCRYRIIVPLLLPVDAEKFQKDCYASRLAAMLMLKVDGCSDRPTQCYYVPSRPKIALKEDHCIIVNESTDLFDANNLPTTAVKTAAKSSQQSDQGDDKIHENYLAVDKCIKNDFDGIAPIFANEKFHIYGNGLWTACSSNDALIRDLIEINDRKLSVADAKILVATMRLSYLKDEFPEANTDKITLLNGTLNLKSDNILERHLPKNYHRSRMEFDYDLEASCARWIQFLDEVFSKNQDKQQKIDFVQEVLGYLLIPSTEYQVMFWLLGAGANGKSVITHMIRKLLGEQNVSSVSIAGLNRQFTIAETVGKLAKGVDLPLIISPRVCEVD